MALFLTENTSVGIASPTTHQMYESYMQAQQAMQIFTESVLRADFALHEQTRVLRENGDAAAADKKEQGFLSKAWEGLKALALKIWNAIKTAYNWVKGKIAQFWAWVKEKYAQVKTWVIDKYKWAKLKLIMGYNAVVSKIKTIDITDTPNVASAVEELKKVRERVNNAPESASGSVSKDKVSPDELKQATDTFQEIQKNTEESVASVNRQLAKQRLDAAVQDHAAAEALRFQQNLVQQLDELSRESTQATIEIMRQMNDPSVTHIEI